MSKIQRPPQPPANLRANPEVLREAGRRVAQTVDRAADAVGNGVRSAGRAIGRAAEHVPGAGNLGNRVAEAADRAGQRIADAPEAAGRAVERAGDRLEAAGRPAREGLAEAERQLASTGVLVGHERDRQLESMAPGSTMRLWGGGEGGASIVRAREQLTFEVRRDPIEAPRPGQPPAPAPGYTITAEARGALGVGGNAQLGATGRAGGDALGGGAGRIEYRARDSAEAARVIELASRDAARGSTGVGRPLTRDERSFLDAHVSAMDLTAEQTAGGSAQLARTDDGALAANVGARGTDGRTLRLERQDDGTWQALSRRTLQVQGELGGSARLGSENTHLGGSRSIQGTTTIELTDRRVLPPGFDPIHHRPTLDELDRAARVTEQEVRVTTEWQTAQGSRASAEVNFAAPPGALGREGLGRLTDGDLRGALATLPEEARVRLRVVEETASGPTGMGHATTVTFDGSPRAFAASPVADAAAAGDLPGTLRALGPDSTVELRQETFTRQRVGSPFGASALGADVQVDAGFERRDVVGAPVLRRLTAGEAADLLDDRARQPGTTHHPVVG